MFLALSPNGTRLAVSVLDPAANARDIWIHDLARDNLRTRFTFDPSDELDAIWSPDGRLLLFHIGNANSQTGNDLWVLPLVGDRKPTPVLQMPFNQADGRVPPDGHWIAYRSNESGRFEVYVMPFSGAPSGAAGATDNTGGKWQVSSTGGFFPRWQRDGTELFYLSADNMLRAATVNGQGSAFEVGAVRALFEARVRTQAYLGYGTGSNYDVSPDGQRFLVNAAVAGRTTAPITLIVNWAAALKP